MNIIIIGCGRMGQGIAITFALAGYKIKLTRANFYLKC